MKALGLALLAAAMPLLAHHSFAAEYDDKKPVSIKGTVTKVEWANQTNEDRKSTRLNSSH